MDGAIDGESIETAAIMAAPMLIFSPSQPRSPMTMRMGRALGTSAIRVQRMLRKAMRSITATPATVMTKLDHWSRSRL